jgi:hypothetical protein
MNTPEQPRCVKTRKVPGGFVLELDNASWVTLMGAISRAIQLEVIDGRGQGEAVEKLEELRKALDND